MYMREACGFDFQGFSYVWKGGMEGRQEVLI